MIKSIYTIGFFIICLYLLVINELASSKVKLFKYKEFILGKLTVPSGKIVTFELRFSNLYIFILSKSPGPNEYFGDLIIKSSLNRESKGGLAFIRL